MWRNIASNALTVLLVVVFLLGGVILWGQSEYKAAGPLGAPVCLQVKSGATMTRVSRDLVDQGAISSDTIFRIGTDYTEKASKLKAGSFLLQPGVSMEGIADIVTRGGASTCGTEVVFRVGVTRQEVQIRELDPTTARYVEVAAFDPKGTEIPALYLNLHGQSGTRYRVAVAEGVTSWQVVNALSGIDILEGTTEVPPEGILAPDSYEFQSGAQRGDIIAQMISRQEARVTDVWQNRTEGLPVKTPEELLVLASIIEKETGIPEERRQVASVFTNRLNKGMKLQTDPTVIYGITKGEGVLGRGLRQSELRRETPWNTYVIPALPPTPIANPGLASLEAAADPDTTDYIFFVADGTGGHAFATTLQEHNRNVANWRKIEAERANQ